MSRLRSLAIVMFHLFYPVPQLAGELEMRDTQVRLGPEQVNMGS